MLIGCQTARCHSHRLPSTGHTYFLMFFWPVARLREIMSSELTCAIAWNWLREFWTQTDTWQQFTPHRANCFSYLTVWSVTQTWFGKLRFQASSQHIRNTSIHDIKRKSLLDSPPAFGWFEVPDRNRGYSITSKCTPINIGEKRFVFNRWCPPCIKT